MWEFFTVKLPRVAAEPTFVFYMAEPIQPQQADLADILQNEEQQQPQRPEQIPEQPDNVQPQPQVC